MRAYYVDKRAYFAKFLVFLLMFIAGAAAVYLLSVLLFGRADPLRLMGGAASAVPDTNAVTAHRVIVLDAGHGGPDSGARAADGTMEKDINLAVALRLRQYLQLSDYRVVMTREDDEWLAVPGADALKRSDLDGRLGVAAANPGAIFVSIHMNQYPDSRYYGFTAYYSANDPESKAIGQLVQDLAKQVLNTTREMKRADSSIYILKKIQNPAILVEGGFMSNPREEALLETPYYQDKIAYTVFCALCAYEG